MRAASFIITSVLFLLTFNLSSSQESGRDTLNLSLPEHDWALSLDFTNFRVKKAGINDKSRMIYASNEKTGIIISIYMEPASSDGDNKDCRDYYWNKLKHTVTDKDEVKFKEIGKLATLEYDIKEMKGTKINQRHLNAYLSYDNIWIDIHLSKMFYEPKDSVLFSDIISTVVIDENYRKTRNDYLAYASSYFINENFEKAALWYQKLLDWEVKEPTIYKTNYWYVIIDNLGMAYGISGDLFKAKEIFEYGIKQDDKYPMFYYNMACICAEMNDFDNTLFYLEKAFINKGNVLEGEKLSDPMKDSSFQKYKDNKRFRELVDKYK